MSLPEEEQADLTTIASIAPEAPSTGDVESTKKSGLLAKARAMIPTKMPTSSEISVTVPETFIESATLYSNPDYKEPTEAFVLRNLKPGTNLESIQPSHFYNDIPAIETSLFEKYLHDEITLSEMEATKAHMAAVNVYILRQEIVNGSTGEALSQVANKLVKHIEVGNVDPVMAEALMELLNAKRRELSGFSRRIFMREFEIRKMCEEAYKKTQKYKAAATDHWTIQEAFTRLDRCETEFALQILTQTRDVIWPVETADLFWRKLRLSTFRQKINLSVEDIASQQEILSRINSEVHREHVSLEEAKQQWELQGRQDTLETTHYDMWCHKLAEGLQITTGVVHNELAETSGLPTLYDYSRFDPVTMWFLVSLHKENSDEFHRFVKDSEKSGFDFWLSYVKSSAFQAN